MRRNILIVCAAFGFTLAVVFGVCCVSCELFEIHTRPQVIIANEAGNAVGELRLSVKPHGDFPVQSWDLGNLQVGDHKVVQHGYSRFYATIEYVDPDGIHRSHQSYMIELWSTEGWIFVVKDDGIVEEIRGRFYPFDK